MHAMEKINDHHLPEKSSSFGRKQGIESNEENAAPGDQPPPSPHHHHDTTAEQQNQTTPADDYTDQENQKEKVVSDNDEENAKTDEKSPPAESTPYSFETVSSDIDQLEESLQQQNAAEQVSSTSKEFEIPRFVDRFLDLFEEKVSKYESTGEDKSKWNNEPEQDSLFLESLDRVSRLLKALKGHYSYSEEIENEKKGG